MPILDHGFVSAVRSRRIQVVPPIERFDGAAVHLHGGTTVRPMPSSRPPGTGPELDSLVGALGVLDDHGMPRARVQTVKHAPRLHFVGIDVTCPVCYATSAWRHAASAGRCQRSASTPNSDHRAGWPHGASSAGPQRLCAVSTLALGTMTFGTETDEDGSRAQLDAFVTSGGNLIDTADVYSDGASEEIAGTAGSRDLPHPMSATAS